MQKYSSIKNKEKPECIEKIETVVKKRNLPAGYVALKKRKTPKPRKDR